MYGNCVLNFSHSAKSEFMTYGDSFYEAAGKLVADIEAKGVYRDFDICPIFYLYRHAIELYLKHICLYCEEIKKITIGTTIEGISCSLATHNLIILFDCASKLFDELQFSEENKKSFKKLKDLVVEINEQDKESFTFRYPTIKNFQDSPFLKKYHIENIFDIAIRANKICDILSGVCSYAVHEYTSIISSITSL